MVALSQQQLQQNYPEYSNTDEPSDDDDLDEPSSPLHSPTSPDFDSANYSGAYTPPSSSSFHPGSRQPSSGKRPSNGSYQATNESMSNDYDQLRENWRKTKDTAQEILKLTKQACKSDFTLVDMFPSLQKEYESLGLLLNDMSDRANTLKYDERQKKKRKESDKNAEKREAYIVSRQPHGL
eukprot:gene1477-1715_t